MSNKICAIENCNNNKVCKGLCDKHYTRLKRNGSTDLKIKHYSHRLNDNSISIPESGCIIWLGSVDSYGYGTISANGKAERTHRLSFISNYGEIPKGMLVCHKCDIPSCINPNHLFLGTHQDNMADRDIKGRQYDRTGTKNGRAKLDNEKANEIRKIFSSTKISKAKLGRMFDVSSTTILGVINNKYWIN